MSDDDNVLWPERTVTLGGDTEVTVHEMTFGQSARLSEHWRPIADELVATIASLDDEQAVQMFGGLAEQHGERLIELITNTVTVDGKPVSKRWVESLKSDDGMILAATWLEVHLHFFAIRRAGKEMFREAVESVRARSTSSPS